VTVVPRSEAELETRALALAGLRLAEVANRFGVTLPPDTKRHKGVIGALLERALGASAGTAAEPDFPNLGVELKTIPVRRDGRPAESTFVCVVPLDRIAEVEWGESTVRKKLARVLFVPIESDTALPLAERRVGTPIFWSPSATEDLELRTDWDELAGLLGAGHVEDVTGHIGRALQVRPKAAGSWSRRRAPARDGAWLATIPRGFYLRATFTERILEAGL
jgi:DNA mismatch repair protein MutH